MVSCKATMSLIEVNLKLTKDESGVVKYERGLGKTLVFGIFLS